MATKVLVTCPPMIGIIGEFQLQFEELDWDITTPNVTQTLSEEELMKILPEYDGWIIGDDPATRRVFEAGKSGRLRAAVKWGVGVDNVDFAAARNLGIPITNTPGVFGEEVGDLALGYVLALARDTFLIDRGVRAGAWPKPRGISLRGKTALVVGFGNIGKATATRLLAVGLRVVVHDPFMTAGHGFNVEHTVWPNGIEQADYVVLTCPLTPETRHMVNADVLARAKPGLRIVNVARGPLIDELALIAALQSGRVHGAALDVFEHEPLPMNSPLRKLETCIFGSHNASNTREAATRATERAIAHLDEMLMKGATE